MLVLVGGLGAGQNNAMQTYIADCSTASARVRDMGLLSASRALVAMSMPQIGLFLQTQVGQTQTFALAVGLGILALVAVLILPETVSAESRNQEKAQTSIYELMASPIRKIFQENGIFLWNLALVLSGGPKALEGPGSLGKAP